MLIIRKKRKKKKKEQNKKMENCVRIKERKINISIRETINEKIFKRKRKAIK